MIRFSCPGCEAVFNVSDDKAGKTGKCPKCSSQFTIPAAPEGSASAPALVTPPAPVAPPPPPAPANGAAVEIAPCPKCGARLSVEAGDIGLEVECPTCRAVYPAEPAVAVKPRNSGSSQKKSLVVAEADPEEEEHERPSRRRPRDDDDRPSRRARSDNDEDDERPRKRKRRRRSEVESKRVTAAILALLLGAYGVHKFYLGYTAAGLIQLFISICTCGVGGIIPFIEFLVYIMKSDDDFIDMYQIGQKEWF